MGQIDLDRENYREIPKGPLGNPRELWRSVIIFLIGALLSGFAGWQLFGPMVGVVFAIPGAMWAGAGVAGLYPAWFFGIDRGHS